MGSMKAFVIYGFVYFLGTPQGRGFHTFGIVLGVVLFP